MDNRKQLSNKCYKYAKILYITASVPLFLLALFMFLAKLDLLGVNGPAGLIWLPVLLPLTAFGVPLIYIATFVGFCFGMAASLYSEQEAKIKRYIVTLGFPLLVWAILATRYTL